jgi:hypothetical protein
MEVVLFKGGSFKEFKESIEPNDKYQIVKEKNVSISFLDLTFCSVLKLLGFHVESLRQ